MARSKSYLDFTASKNKKPKEDHDIKNKSLKRKTNLWGSFKSNKDTKVEEEDDDSKKKRASKSKTDDIKLEMEAFNQQYDAYMKQEDNLSGFLNTKTLGLK